MAAQRRLNDLPLHESRGHSNSSAALVVRSDSLRCPPCGPREGTGDTLDTMADPDSPRDICPDTEPARLSWQARALLDQHTAPRAGRARGGTGMSTVTPG